MSNTNITNEHILLECIIAEKIKNYERINPEIVVKGCPQIYKFIVLQSLLELKVIYHINDFKSDKFFMTLLNQEKTKKHGYKFENHDANNPETIKEKAEYDFILKHDDITNEFMVDYDILHQEMNYDRQ